MFLVRYADAVQGQLYVETIQRGIHLKVNKIGSHYSFSTLQGVWRHINSDLRVKDLCLQLYAGVSYYNYS